MSTIDGYDAVMALSRDQHQTDWLPIVRAAYEEAAAGHHFAGAWIAAKVGWFPSLRPLAAYGILEKVATTRQGRRAYYRMPDREGVGRALRDLGRF